jgi:hypothetical protein
MRFATRRIAILSAASAAGALLAGCGASERSQAAALELFLRTRVLDRQGIAVPRPTPEERQNFGRFAADYDIILAFHDQMNQTVIPRVGDVIRRGSFNRAQDFIDRRGDIAAAQEAMRSMGGGFTAALTTARTAKAALNQPEPLKATYDKAFDKVVSQPADILQAVMPASDAIFTQGLAFSDFLKANRSEFKFDGLVVETSRADLLTEFNERAQKLQAAGETLLAAQRRLQIAIRGQ